MVIQWFLIDLSLVLYSQILEKMTFVDIMGFISVFMILIAYFLNMTSGLVKDSLAFLLLNLIDLSRLKSKKNVIANFSKYNGEKCGNLLFLWVRLPQKMFLRSIFLAKTIVINSVYRLDLSLLTIYFIGLHAVCDFGRNMGSSFILCLNSALEARIDCS